MRRVLLIGDEIRAAWANRYVRRGFYGTLLIALGAFSPAYLPRTSPWWQWANALGATGWAGRTVGTVLTMSGLFILVDAWFRLRPHSRPDADHPRLRHWAILVIWGAPFLLAPPIFSHDAYSYAAQGWLIHNGINPYEAGPSLLPGAFADQVAWVWRDTPAPYGPLSLRIQYLIVCVTGFRPYLSAVMMRIPAVIGVGVIGLLIPRIARARKADPDLAAWFATLNPVLVIDFIGGCHNDCLMMAFVVAALWVTTFPTPRSWRWKRLTVSWDRFGSPWWLVGAVLVGIGAAIKQPAIMAAYALPLMTRPWARVTVRETAVSVMRICASCLIAVGSFVLVTVLTGLGFGWFNAVNVPGQVVTIAPSTVIGQGVQIVLNLLGFTQAAHHAVRTARTVGMIVAGLCIAVMAVTIARRRPVRFLSLAYLAAALGLPAVRSWYILWGGLLLPLSKARTRTWSAAIWVTMVLLCYNAINMAWRNDAVALGCALAVGVWLLTRIHEYNLRRKAHQPAAKETP